MHSSQVTYILDYEICKVTLTKASSGQDSRTLIQPSELIQQSTKIFHFRHCVL